MMEPGKIRAAIENDGLNCPFLTGADPERGRRGAPLMWSGGFGRVYRFKSSDGRRWAVKAYSQPPGDLAERYRENEALLRRMAGRRRFVQAEFLPAGLRVDGGTTPVAVSEWVEDGLGLEVFFGNHSGTETNRKVLEDFLAFLEDLRAENCAHGDLQHGNLFVVPGENRIVAIDYDSLRGHASRLPLLTTGHVAFQHPGFSGVETAQVDHFPAWIICLSMVALVFEPGLFARSRSELRVADTFLFSQADHTDPERPDGLVSLLRRSDSLRAVADAYLGLLRMNPADVPACEREAVHRFFPQLGLVRVVYPWSNRPRRPVPAAIPVPAAAAPYPWRRAPGANGHPVRARPRSAVVNGKASGVGVGYPWQKKNGARPSVNGFATSWNAPRTCVASRQGIPGQFAPRRFRSGR